MSTLLSQKSKDAIFGYFHSFDVRIPLEIIDICILFSNVGEEFDTRRSTLPIEGANHTICKYAEPPNIGKCFGFNIISSSRHAFYHWRLIIRTLCDNYDDPDFTIGIAEMDSPELKYQVEFTDASSNMLIDLYVDLKTNEMSLYKNRRCWDNDDVIDISKEYRLAIASCGISFEILEFNVANPGDSDVNLALARDLYFDHKIKYFESAINTNPNSFTYCDEYIALLLFEEEYVKAYHFILRFVERRWIPMRYIAEIAGWSHDDDKHTMSKKMCDLIDDESFMEMKASNYYFLKDYENALKYFEFCLANTNDKATISSCLSGISGQTKEENIDKCILLTNMANLLYAMKRYDESIPFFEKSLQIDDDLNHPQVGPKCLENYANVLYLRQKYERSNDLLYQLIGRNDFAQHPNKDVVYWLMSLNFEKVGNVKKAMQYAKKAHRIQPKELYASKMKKRGKADRNA